MQPPVDTVSANLPLNRHERSSAVEFVSNHDTWLLSKINSGALSLNHSHWLCDRSHITWEDAYYIYIYIYKCMIHLQSLLLSTLQNRMCVVPFFSPYVHRVICIPYPSPILVPPYDKHSWLRHIHVKQVRFPSRATENNHTQVPAFTALYLGYVLRCCLSALKFALKSCSDVKLMLSPASREMRQAYLLFIRQPVLSGCWHSVAPLIKNEWMKALKERNSLLFHVCSRLLTSVVRLSYKLFILLTRPSPTN